jgi:mRNA interferase MazF
VTPDLHRGDIWWADVPGDKRRPVLVLTRERFIPRLTSVLVAPVTTAVRGIPTEVAMGPADGMPHTCAATTPSRWAAAASWNTSRCCHPRA